MLRLKVHRLIVYELLMNIKINIHWLVFQMKRTAFSVRSEMNIRQTKVSSLPLRMRLN